MADDSAGRPNQRRRTRKDLLRAASRLMRDGHKPTLEEIAEEALVSRATAYRYFPGVEALLLEASLDVAVPEVADVLPADAPPDPVERLQRVDAALHDMVVANEAALRASLGHILIRSATAGGPDDVPLRQNRRTPLIEAALAPARDQFDPAALRRLERIAALLVGPDAMIVFKDVLQLDDDEARDLKRWAIRALVDAARTGTHGERRQGQGATGR